MAETMYAAPGVGLAATQVDVHKRVIVIDISETRDELRVLHQPGDLSQPRARPSARKAASRSPATTTRSPGPRRSASARRTRDGKPFELAADGLLAVCIQHEMDHLLGKVFVDYLSPLKRARLDRQAAARSSAWPADRRPSAIAVGASVTALRVGFAGTPAFAARALEAIARRRLHDTAGPDPAR